MRDVTLQVTDEQINEAEEVLINLCRLQDGITHMSAITKSRRREIAHRNETIRQIARRIACAERAERELQHEINGLIDAIREHAKQCGVPMATLGRMTPEVARIYLAQAKAALEEEQQ